MTRAGATPLGGDRCAFRVWAPACERVDVHLLEPADRLEPMRRVERGWFEATLDDVPPGALYRYRLDGGEERPDPASRHQPQGVHGPSRVVAHEFAWSDGGWRGIELHRHVFYELHVGTFTSGGTFDSAIDGLDRLVELGVTTVELMPVAQFPGERNWGYDGVLPYAVQDSYGGPEGLKRLVDACHARGVAVCLDVVYNHLGPEGNYLREFGPYFTSTYHTPWGDAINYDDAGSDEVRRFFIDNALEWLDDYHFDALRLDAVHAILDRSARHFLEQLAEEVAELSRRRGRPMHLIAESDLNDPRLIRERDRGGYGLDAQWADDFHHAVHARMTGERRGYYRDYGRMEHIARALAHGYVFTGQRSEFRGRSHGADPSDLPGERFVVAIQNHDQVGNRMAGERLSELIDAASYRAAAATHLLSPFLPLLWMGEEYAERAPFPYFVSHSDPGLVEAVRKGRREEFSGFDWQGEPPDPQAESTFASARIDPAQAQAGEQAGVLALYRDALRLRRERPALAGAAAAEREVELREDADTLLMTRVADDGRESLFVLRATPADEHGAAVGRGARDQGGAADQAGSAHVSLPPGTWCVLLDSDSIRYGGGAPDDGGSVTDRIALQPRHAMLLERES